MGKYLDLEKWLDDNGVKRPGVEYPVAFGRHGELVGFAASQDIPPQTAFVFVPQSLHISEPSIRIRAPYFGEFIDRNHELFRKHYDAVYMPMIIYMWHEQLKGEDSFWYPYFETINTCDMPHFW